MGIEIEAKMKVEDFAPLRERLRNAGAEPAGEAIEQNVFFDTPGATLRDADQGLRLRTTKNLQSGQSKHVFTFKGPRQPGPLKRREEVEAEVDSFESGTALLRALGYQQTLSFEKRRESWLLRGCKVELDTLPYLGTFAEIEGPGEAVVMAVRHLLQLDEAPSLQSGYVSMLMEHLQQHGISIRELRLNG